MIDASDLHEAIANAAERPRSPSGRLPVSHDDAERRVRLTLKRVLTELPYDVTVGELMDLLD